MIDFYFISLGVLLTWSVWILAYHIMNNRYLNRKQEQGEIDDQCWWF